MDVQCERCKTEYEFDDALVSGRGTTVRCTNCGHQFKVRSHDATDPGSDQWLVHTGSGHRLTFVSLRELQRAILARQVARTDVLVRGGGNPRSLGSIAELEPFFEGTASNRPSGPSLGPPSTSVVPPMQSPGASRAGDPAGSPVSFPKRTAQWSPDAAASPYVARVPSPGSLAPPRRTDSFGAPPEYGRPKIDTLRPPPDASAAPPPPSSAPSAGLPGLRSAGALSGGQAAFDVPMDGRGGTAVMETHGPASSRTPASHRPDSIRGPDHLPEMRGPAPSLSPDDDFYGIPRRRRVGGWVVAFVLLLAAGVGGWGVARPYLLARGAGATARLDPRAQQFVSEGERAMSSGDLESAQQAFDKASALAERDPRVVLDEARISATKADILWLKLRLLPGDTSDEARTTKLQLEEAVARARRTADEALAAAPEDPAAVRAKIDAQRLAGEKDLARSSVSRVLALGSQPETAYVLAALDLAEPDPLWTTVVDRLRTAAAGEASAGRARAALVYALARSGDSAGARAELTKLDSLARPYPLVPSLHAFVDKTPARAAPERGPAANMPGVAGSSLSALRQSATAAGPGAASPGGGATPAVPSPAPALASTRGGGDESSGGETTGGLQAAAQAIKRGDWGRARQIYEALVTRNPSDSEALAGIGDVDRAQGNTTGAIAAYKRALAVNPSYLPALLGVADTEWASGDRAAATRTYKEVVDRFPEGTYPSYVKTRIEGGSAAPEGAASGGPATGANRVPAGEREGL